jgi:hypothetical protein
MSRPLTIVALTGCAIIGIYGAMYVGATNGFFDALTAAAVTPPPAERSIPGSPAPFKSTYTGFVPVDAQLSVLVGFFCCILDGGRTWDVTLGFWYVMAQFLVGWCLLSLEGLRVGNRGRAAGW